MATPARPLSLAPPISTFNAFDELGYSGLRSFSGRIEDSTLKNLRGYRRNDKLRTMAETDDIVGGILLAYETLGKSASWRVEEGDSTPEQAEFLTGCLEDMSRDWADVLSGIFTFLPYGFAPHEVVYKRRLGLEPGRRGDSTPRPTSNFNDGKIGWNKWALRAQTSIHRWHFDENGEVRGMWQTIENTDVRRKAGNNLASSIIGSEVFIPIEKLLLFRTTAKKNNPEGFSIMENAFKQWFIKNHLIEMEAVGAERDLVGYPIIYADEDTDIWGEGAEDVAKFNRAMELATGMRRDELMGAVFPHNWKVELIRSGGAQAVDLDKLIKAKNQGISISMLADFILIGHEGSGSYALRKSADNFFTRALGGILDIMQSTMNRQEVPRLMKLNAFPPPWPKIVHGDPVAPDLELVLKAIKELRDSGSEIPTLPEIQRAILELAGLPVPEEIGEPMMGRESEWDDIPARPRASMKHKYQFYDGLSLVPMTERVLQPSAR